VDEAFGAEAGFNVMIFGYIERIIKVDKFMISHLFKDQKRHNDQ
jgi:hypothetical protein